MAADVIEVKGKKYSPEEIAAALETMKKIRDQREKAKARVKEMTPEQKAVLKKKMAFARQKNALILYLAAQAGINPSDKEVVEYAKIKGIAL